MSTAFKLFDHACYGVHPVARPVIGSRANIRRFTRDDAGGAASQQQYTGANVVVGVAGNVDADAIVAAARRRSATCRAAAPTASRPPTIVGGIRSRRLPGSSQAHVVARLPGPRLLGRAPAPPSSPRRCSAKA